MKLRDGLKLQMLRRGNSMEYFCIIFRCFQFNSTISTLLSISRNSPAKTNFLLCTFRIQYPNTAQLPENSETNLIKKSKLCQRNSFPLFIWRAAPKNFRNDLFGKFASLLMTASSGNWVPDKSSLRRSSLRECAPRSLLDRHCSFLWEEAHAGWNR